MECDKRDEFLRALTEIDAMAKSNAKRIDELAEDRKALNDMALSLRELVTKQDCLTRQMDGIEQKVTAIEGKGGKRLDKIVDKIIDWLLVAVLAIIAAKIGLG